MAADLLILVRNDFHELDDLAQAKMYAESTIKRINELLGAGAVTHFVCNEDLDGHADVYIEVSLEGQDEEWLFLTLGNGYWKGCLGFHCKDLLYDSKGVFPLRNEACLLAKILGQNEVWYTNDMSMDQFDETISLDDYIAAEKINGYYAEFAPEELLKLPLRERPLYSVYHDKFEY